MDFGQETRHPNRKEEKLRVVEIRCVPTPDAQGRLCRAINILLRSVARDTTEGQESLPPDAKKHRGRVINRREDKG